METYEEKEKKLHTTSMRTRKREREREDPSKEKRGGIYSKSTCDPFPSNQK